MYLKKQATECSSLCCMLRFFIQPLPVRICFSFSLSTCYTAVLWSDLWFREDDAIISWQTAVSVLKERWIKVRLQLPSRASVHCFLSDWEISPNIKLIMFRCFRLELVSAAYKRLAFLSDPLSILKDFRTCFWSLKFTVVFIKYKEEWEEHHV